MRYIVSTFLLIGFLLVVPAAAESVLDAPAGANSGAAMHNGAGVRPTRAVAIEKPQATSRRRSQ